ncbi:MAG: ATP-binding cassette domain-containing protein [Candidatus Glassbacteria bacterium]|nr:ATP-binding cassette domain-containing protein [Candidatus Glassbacteria bacterium]
MSDDALVIEGVSKSYREVRAVQNLSARLPAGSIYGFLGPNGAGKTTTIRMIMDIIRPDSGSIRVLGQDSAARARDRIGYMPEERGLYRKMKVRSMLAYLGAIKGMQRSEAARAITAWLDELGLSAWGGKKVEELSRGMQQKLQFAATVINDPELLILDEPFSGLDPLNLDLLKGIMLRLRESGSTVIFSTHMMEQAERLCDYLLLINKGEKVIDGTLGSIRAGFKSNAVSVELEGDPSFVGGLPMVSAVARAGARLEAVLEPGADPQEFLKALVDKARVRAFEIKVPSLHEIFVSLVEEKK